MKYFPLSLVLAPLAAADFGPLTSITTTQFRVRAELIDIDGDGILDLLTLDSLLPLPQLALGWSKGGDALPFGASQPIATLNGELSAIAPGGLTADCGDLDGDGFRDLVVATADGLLRFDGLSGSQFSSPSIIDRTPCTHVEVIDLDQDGDLDLVKGGFENPTGAEDGIYINDGAGLLRPLPIPGLCCFSSAPLFTDADQDGDLDFVVNAGDLRQPTYFENLGGLAFAPGVDIPLPSNSPFIALGDVDQDGDDDLLYAYFAQNPGGWLENVSGDFSTNHVVVNMTLAVSAPRVGDVDGDGDVDLVFVEDLSGASWFANNGNDQFPFRSSIDTGITWASMVGLADVNGDQAVDILFTGEGPRGVLAYLNTNDLGGDVCVAIANSTGVPAALRASGSRSVGANRFTLTLDDAPPGQLAAFLVGRTTQISMLPGSAGVLCLGSPFAIFRGPDQIQPIDAGGVFRLNVDLTAVPGSAGLQSVQSGETWLFQSFFRDLSALGTTNLSPAVEITFVP
jgi:hypothetical protein